MNTVTIRRFQPQDQRQVKALITRIMDDEFHDEKHAYPMEDLQDLGTHYGELGESFFVAENSHQIIGTAGIKKEDSRTALLRRLFVSPEYRKQNVGKKLIHKAVEFCEEVGYEEIIFKATSRMESAIRMLQRCGFSQCSKLPAGKIELVKLLLLLPAGQKKLKA